MSVQCAQMCVNMSVIIYMCNHSYVDVLVFLFRFVPANYMRNKKLQWYDGRQFVY